MAKLKTGRHTSALKEVRRAETKRQHNSGLKKSIKKAAKDFLVSIEKGDIKTSQKLLKEVYSKWDKAAKSGAIAKNTASRKKSRLAMRLTKKKSA